jgi:hypothetical protein
MRYPKWQEPSSWAPRAPRRYGDGALARIIAILAFAFCLAVSLGAGPFLFFEVLDR